MSETQYDETFFAYHEELSRQSARETLPVLFQFIRPASVVDVGCGIGTWLAEFKAAGVTDYLGVDGDYVDRARLLIEPERFLGHDLGQPLEVGRRFDLAMSLEVAEHLPLESAETFVASLTRLAPVVFFSAAIPHQRGTGHINEQWPEFWNAHFQQHDYQVIDCLRMPLWMNRQIASWYRQNMLLFVERSRLGDYPELSAAFEKAGPNPPLGIVHPTLYLERHEGLFHELRQAQCLAMRHLLRLRDLSVAAFPDWSQPQVCVDQLRSLLGAMASHPDRARLSLVLHIENQDVGTVGGILRSVGSQFPPDVQTRLAAGPDVSTVNASFSREQWVVLLACLQARVTLPGENKGAIAAAGAQAFRSVTLSQIEAGNPLGKT